MDPEFPQDETGANEELLKTCEERSYFVSALSHDMKANFLVLEHAFRRLKQQLEGVHVFGLETVLSHFEAYLSESKRFLDELVTLGKTGISQMEPEPVDLGRVIDDVVGEQEEFIRRRGVDLRILEPIPPVFCNPLRAKQVVTNLLCNAILHGCDWHEPEVRVSAEPVRRRMVRLEVHDNGKGIPPELHEAIFLPGRRISSMTEGHGMGLAIVRKIAEYYGGSARVVPTAEQGTTMEVLLPAVSEANPPLAAMSAQTDHGESHTSYDPPHAQSAVLHSAFHARRRGKTAR